MPFGNISVFYIAGTFTNAGVGGIRARLRDTADATNDTSTQNVHPANGSTSRVCIPQQVSDAISTSTNFGFAIARADMGSVEGALRFFPAGAHTMRFYAAGGNTLGNNQYTLRIYRVRSNNSVVQLGDPNYSVQASGLGAQVAITANLPEIIFAPDETIFYVLFSVVNPGLVAGTVTFSFGTSSALTGSVVARVETPELGVLAKARGASAGAATAQGQSSVLLAARGAAVGVASVQGQASSTAGAQGRAEGVATVQAQGSAVAGVQGRAAGAASVNGQASVVLGAVGTAVVGSGQSVIRRKRVVIFDRA